MRRRTTPRPSRAAGLTLIELMITLIIASLVATSTFVFFSGQQRIYDTQTKLLNIQQSVTAAMELMVRYVRVAGNGMLGCVRLDNDAGGPDNGDPAPVSASTALTAAPATGLRAYLNGTGVIRIPPVWIVDGAAGAPDTLTIAFGNGTFGNWFDTALGASIATDTPATSPLMTTAGLQAVWMPNEFAVILNTAADGNINHGSPLLDDRGCTLFQITSTAANQLLHASTSVWNPAADVAGMVPFTYVGGATPDTGIRNFGALNWIRFAIQPGTATTPPALTMQRLDQVGSAAQVLADGIEDLQVAYACDTNNDGTLTEGPNKLADEWVLNASGDTIPTNCNRPQAVRITLIARSLTPDTLLASVATNVKPAVENGAAGAAADEYRHRVVTTTVFPRNDN